MLLAVCSPKGGSGTSVFAAACSLVLARSGGARLADLCGDQPALLGLAVDPPTGLADWLAAGPGAPTGALDRLAVDAAPGLDLVPAGAGDVGLGAVAPEAGAALAVALRDGAVPAVADLGTAAAPAARAMLEVADAVIVVVRGCYLALRRAVRDDRFRAATAAVLVEEPQRALGGREVADVLAVPLVATVPWRASIARTIDAGVLPARLPDQLARPARQALERLGIAGHSGAAA